MVLGSRDTLNAANGELKTCWTKPDHEASAMGFQSPTFVTGGPEGRHVGFSSVRKLAGVDFTGTEEYNNAAKRSTELDDAG